jgi:hypothetical protein
MADVPPPNPNPLPDPRRGGAPGGLGGSAGEAAEGLGRLAHEAGEAAQAWHQASTRLAGPGPQAVPPGYVPPPLPPPVPPSPVPPPPGAGLRAHAQWLAQLMAGPASPPPPPAARAPGPPAPPPPPVPTAQSALACQVAGMQQRAAQAQVAAQAVGTPQGQTALAEAARAQRAAAQAQERATREVGMGQRAGTAGLRAGVAASYGSVSGVAGALGEFAGGAAGGPLGAAIGSAVASAAGGLVERLVNEVERTRAVANPMAYSTREKSEDLLRATVGGPLGRGDLQAAAVQQERAAAFGEMGRQARAAFGDQAVEAFQMWAMGARARPPLLDFAGMPPTQTLGYEQAAVGLGSAGLSTSPLEAATLREQLKNMADAMGSHLPDISGNTRPDAFGWGAW